MSSKKRASGPVHNQLQGFSNAKPRVPGTRPKTGSSPRSRRKSGDEVITIQLSNGILRLKVMRGFFERLLAPMTISKLRANQGVLILHCKRIRTWGLNKPIDIVFLDKKANVIDVLHRFEPWGAAHLPVAYAVIGLPAGFAAYANIRIDDNLKDALSRSDISRRSRRSGKPPGGGATERAHKRPATADDRSRRT